MSETASPKTASRRQSAGYLKTIIVTFLTPMFLWSCGGDPGLARLAAIETLDEFGILGHHGLITAAKIIAYELAALSSLSQSMADDIPPALALRLRGNANSLDRAAERNRRVLEHEQQAAKAPPVDVDAVDVDALAASVAETRDLVRAAKARMQVAPAPEMSPRPEAAPQSRPLDGQSPAPVSDMPVPPAPVSAMPAEPAPARPSRHGETQSPWNAAWAEAMAAVAADFTADMARLPPAERAREKGRIDALLAASTALASGTAAPFGIVPGSAGRPGGAGGNALEAMGLRQRPG